MFALIKYCNFFSTKTCTLDNRNRYTIDFIVIGYHIADNLNFQNCFGDLKRLHY